MYFPFFYFILFILFIYFILFYFSKSILCCLKGSAIHFWNPRILFWPRKLLFRPLYRQCTVQWFGNRLYMSNKRGTLINGGSWARGVVKFIILGPCRKEGPGATCPGYIYRGCVACGPPSFTCCSCQCWLCLRSSIVQSLVGVLVQWQFLWELAREFLCGHWNSLGTGSLLDDTQCLCVNWLALSLLAGFRHSSDEAY